jgi:hypothetical protein
VLSDDEVRLTEEQYAEIERRRAGLNRISIPAPIKKSKFKNIRCRSMDGKNFASRLERDYYEQLLLRWKAGDVRWFILQPNFDLEGGVVYRADFLIVTAAGDVDVIDTKGCLTQESRNKIKQLKARYGIEVQLVREV